MPFIQALMAMGYQLIPLSGESYEKVVDIGIKRTLAAIADREGDVLLASHDGDFAPEVEVAGRRPDRRVGLLAFREFTSALSVARPPVGCRRSTSSTTSRPSTCSCRACGSSRSTSSTRCATSDAAGGGQSVAQVTAL